MTRLESIRVLALSGICAAAIGCQTDTETSDEVDGFRAALPLTEAVQVDGPDSTGEATVTPLDPSTPYAKYYKFTRQVRDDVNSITRQVLGAVWFVVHTKPTHLSSSSATWGPYTDSLEPATYRFRVTRNADGGYEYAWEGRPKQSISDADYRVVLQGLGYAKADPRHGDGQFTVDLDVAKGLDPAAHEQDTGKVIVVHDLPPTISAEVGALPRVIDVVAVAKPDGEQYHIVSKALADRTGTLVVEAVADLDPNKTTQLENVVVESRWNAQGAGRADVTLAAGDVPAAMDPVTAAECWDSNFKQTYYHDSAGIEADAGVATSCIYTSGL